MKAVLFDFGGTLDTGGVHWSEKYRDLYATFGVGISREELERAFVWSEQQLLLEQELPRATLRRTIDRQLSLQFSYLKLEGLKLEGKDGIREQMLDACYRDVVEVASKAAEILMEAGRRYKLGVVSNFYGNLAVVCAELGFAKYFDVMIDSALVGVRKPDPEIFRIATGELAVAPEETFMVGDSYERDVVPAKIIGCRTIWLRGRSRTAASPAAAPGISGGDSADYTVAELGEIGPILSAASPPGGVDN